MNLLQKRDIEDNHLDSKKNHYGFVTSWFSLDYERKLLRELKRNIRGFFYSKILEKQCSNMEKKKKKIRTCKSRIRN